MFYVGLHRVRPDFLTTCGKSSGTRVRTEVRQFVGAERMMIDDGLGQKFDYRLCDNYWTEPPSRCALICFLAARPLCTAWIFTAAASCSALSARNAAASRLAARARCID